MADAKTRQVSKYLHIGSMGWSYAFWKPRFYPKELSSSDYLSYYSKSFGSVEVDNTFYRIPRTQTIKDWKQQTPEGFLFSLKFPQKITHVKMLKDCQEDTKIFLERVDLLEEKLGVLLLQFPPTFTYSKLSSLVEYLKTLPKRNRYAVEVRNKSLYNEKLFALLREYNVALTWVDSHKMPLITELTADFLYIRWEGDRKTVRGTLGNLEVDKTASIQEWVNRLAPFLNSKNQVFGYFSKYFSGFPPSDILSLEKISMR